MSTVIIIGGGIAGAATAAAMQRAGHEVTVVTAGTIGDGASGNPLAALYPLFTAKPSSMGDFYLAAYQHALAALKDCPAFTQTGVANYPKTLNDLHKWQNITEQSALQPYVQLIDTPPDEPASDAPVLLFPGAGLIAPSILLPWLLDTVSVQEARRVENIYYQGNTWHVQTRYADFSTPAPELTADIVVLACSNAVQQFIPWLPLEPVRGQLTYLAPTAETISYTTPTCRAGYVLPVDLQHAVSFHVLGSSYRRHQTNTNLTTLEHVENLNRLATLWPQAYSLLSSSIVGGRASVRARSTDTLPYAGPVPNYQLVTQHYQHHGWQKPLPDECILPGLYTVCGLGSRGFTTAWLLANIIAGAQHVPKAVQHTVSPVRVLQRLARRGQLPTE